jgi:hypothetical protein
VAWWRIELLLLLLLLLWLAVALLALEEEENDLRWKAIERSQPERKQQRQQ